MSDSIKSGDHSGDFDPTEAGSAPHAAPVDASTTDTTLVYPPEGREAETAQALLAAADDPNDVKFLDGAFSVPAKVASKAKLPDGGAADTTDPVERNVKALASGKHETAQADARIASPTDDPTPTKAPAKRPAGK